MSKGKYLDVSGYAKKWHVEPATVRYWIYSNKLPDAYQDEPGHPWHIPEDEVPEHKKKK